MRADLNTACLACTSLNSAKLSGMELGIRGMSHVDIPAPIAWYDIEKDGKNNDSIDREIVTDFSGNGRHLSLCNFAFSGFSGYNGYEDWVFPKRRNEYVDGLKRNIDILDTKTRSSFSFVVSNMKKGDYIYAYQRARSSINPKKDEVWIKTDGKYLRHGKYLNHNMFFEFNLSPGVVIEVLPSYRGLVFDQYDDYAVFEGDLGLKDYTVFFERMYYGNTINPYSYLTEVPLISSIDNDEKGTPFILDGVIETENTVSGYKKLKLYSYGKDTSFSFKLNENNNATIVQTPNEYRQYYDDKLTKIRLRRGTSVNTGRGLRIGRSSFFIFKKLVVFDEVLTDEQIEVVIKKYKLKI